MRRFVMIKTYASLCGISVDGVLKRIQRGKLNYSIFCEMPAIDVEEYPPNIKKVKKVTLPEINKTYPPWMYD